MKGFRFYLEYGDEKAKRKGTVKHPGRHDGNVIALMLEADGRSSYIPGTLNAECISAVYDRKNSPVCVSSVGVFTYLQPRCRRIPESLARKIHPQLFHYLEQ